MNWTPLAILTAVFTRMGLMSGENIEVQKYKTCTQSADIFGRRFSVAEERSKFLCSSRYVKCYTIIGNYWQIIANGERFVKIMKTVSVDHYGVFKNFHNNHNIISSSKIPLPDEVKSCNQSGYVKQTSVNFY